MDNATMLTQLALGAMQQALSYQTVLAKAQAEGRQPTDEEVAEARGRAVQAIEDLKNMP